MWGSPISLFGVIPAHSAAPGQRECPAQGSHTGAVARRKAAQHRWVEDVLLRQHPRGEAVGRVAGVHGHARLPEHGAVVERGRDLVDGAARLAVAGGERAGMGVEPAIVRQQRRVDVEHPPLPRGDEARGEHPHEAGETDDVDGVRRQRRREPGLERGAVAAEGAVIDELGGDALGPRPGEPARLRAVGEHQRRARGVIAGHRGHQRAHVGPAAGEEDRDASAQDICPV